MELLKAILNFGIGIFVVAVVGVYALNWFVPHLEGDDYITVYQRICLPKVVGTEAPAYQVCKNAGGSTYVLASKFRVDYGRQRVFALGSVTTFRYDNCVVADKANWTCQYSDGSGWIQITNGEILRSKPDSTEQIGWVDYLLSNR